MSAAGRAPSGRVADQPRISLAAWPIHAAVRLYQWVFAWRPSPCRYVPTCSNYALEALELHGAVRGSWLAVRRIGRCHPWADNGWDPVPRPAGDRHHHHHRCTPVPGPSDAPPSPKAA